MPIFLMLGMQAGLRSPLTELLPARVAGAAQTARRFGHTCIAVRYVHTDEAPAAMLLGDASLQDADDTALVPELEGLVDRCAQHDGYGLSDELLGALLVENPSHIYLAGLDVDAHVMHAAFQLFNAGLRPIVIAPLCGSTGGRSAALHALALLRRNIGVQNVLPSLPWRATPVDGTTAVAALPIPGISASRMFQ